MAYGGTSAGTSGTYSQSSVQGSGKIRKLPNGYRGVWWGGTHTTGTKDSLDYISITTGGNAEDFGEMSEGETNGAATSDGSRGVYGGGSPNRDGFQYITISNKGTAHDFNELTEGRHELAATSDGNRGIFSGGGPPEEDVIDYKQIKAGGNATDFGNMTAATRAHGACSNGTKAFLGGGSSPPAGASTKIDYITIGTAANAVDYGGVLTEARHYVGSCSDGVRGIFAGGDPVDATIDYIQMDTYMDAVDFGDLFDPRYLYDGCSDGHKAVWAGGYDGGNASTIEHVHISIPGNGMFYGDLSSSRNYIPGSSGG